MDQEFLDMKYVNSKTRFFFSRKENELFELKKESMNAVIIWPQEGWGAINTA